MGSHGLAPAPDGTPHWLRQRAHRLARHGLSVAAIATRLSLKTDDVRSLLRHPGAFQRCPTCGGMVKAPCAACSISGRAAAASTA